MESEEIERALLSSLKTSTQLNTLRQTYKITPRHFPYHPEEANFIWEFILEYGEAPEPDILTTRFPKFAQIPLDNFDYIAREFRNDHIRRSVYVAIDGHESSLSKDAESATQSLINQLQSLMRYDESSRLVLDSEAEDRFDNYKLRGEGFSKFRLSWGIDPLDREQVPFFKGQFIGLLADTKVGKSWIALKIGLQNYIKGRKVLIISPELTTLELECRTDTLLGFLHDLPISNHALMYGLSGIEENYKKLLSLLDREQLILYPSTPSERLTPSAIGSLIRADAPDLIVIDGIYMVDDDDTSNLAGYEHMKNKCRDLKTLATLTNTALVVTNQTNRSTDANTDIAPPALANLVSGGYDFNRFVDALVSIGGTPGSTDTRQIAVPLIRNGPAVTKAYEISFIPNTGDIGTTVGEDTPMEFNPMVV